MQQFTQLNPELFIADCPQLQEYKCALCFQIRLNMRKCGGPCQKNMCALCLRQYYMKTRCPICKEQFQIQEAPLPQIFLVCPSLSQQCVIGKLQKEKFFEHASACLFIPEPQRTQFKYKSNYQCQCSGKLRIYDDERTCCECNLTSSCSNCTKCRKKYCLQCRKPPLRKGFCVRGHRFTKETSRENDTVCDLCELPIYHLSIRTQYADPQCQFDICAICLNALSEGNLQPFHEQPSEEEGDEESSQWVDERNYEEENEEEREIGEREQLAGGGEEEGSEEDDDDQVQLGGEEQEQPSSGEIQDSQENQSETDREII